MAKKRNTKVVGVAPTETEKHRQIGKLRQNGLVYGEYYSCGYHYYTVDRGFEFKE